MQTITTSNADGIVSVVTRQTDVEQFARVDASGAATADIATMGNRRLPTPLATFRAIAGDADLDEWASDEEVQECDVANPLLGNFSAADEDPFGHGHWMDD